VVAVAVAVVAAVVVVLALGIGVVVGEACSMIDLIYLFGAGWMFGAAARQLRGCGARGLLVASAAAVIWPVILALVVFSLAQAKMQEEDSHGST
jgi:hypothetical protein